MYQDYKDQQGLFVELPTLREDNPHYKEPAEKPRKIYKNELERIFDILENDDKERKKSSRKLNKS